MKSLTAVWRWELFSPRSAKHLFFAYLLAVGLRILWPGTVLLFGILNTMAQVYLGVGACLAFRALANAEARPPLFRVLSLALGLFAGSDLIYGAIVNIAGYTELRGTWTELTYNIPYMIVWVVSAWAFVLLLNPLSSAMKGASVALFASYVIALALSYLPVIRQESLTSISTSVHVICFLCKGVVLTSALVNGVLNQSRAVMTLCLSFIVIISYSLFLEYFEIVGALSPGLPTEVFWSLGLYLSWNAGMMFHEDPDVDDVNCWSVKTVSFSACLLIISTTVILHQITSHFSRTTDLPTAGIVLSAFATVIIICGVLGDFVRHSVLASLDISGDEGASPPRLVGVPNISEFKSVRRQMAQRLSEAQSMSSIAISSRMKFERLCHDLKSPLTVLSMMDRSVAADSHKNRLISQAAGRIRSIADGYLDERRNNLTNRTPCEHVESAVSSAVEEQIITHPLFENWIHYERPSMSESRAFVPLAKSQITTAISHLIQNSIDSVSQAAGRKQITIRLSETSESVVIVIEDSGGGFSQCALVSLQKKQGFTSKVHGNGIGLLSVIDQFDRVGGSLTIANDGMGGRGARLIAILPKVYDA